MNVNSSLGEMTGRRKVILQTESEILNVFGKLIRKLFFAKLNSSDFLIHINVLHAIKTNILIAENSEASDMAESQDIFLQREVDDVLESQGKSIATAESSDSNEEQAECNNESNKRSSLSIGLNENENEESHLNFETPKNSSIKFTFNAQVPRRRKLRQMQIKRKYSELAGCKNAEGNYKKGRYKSVVWEHFTTTKDTVTKKIISNQCKKCSIIVSAKAHRLKEHLKKCKKETLSTALSQTTLLSNRVVETIAEPKVPAKCIIFPSESEVKSRMKSWVDASGPKEKAAIDKLLAKFIFSANIPCTVVENPYFKDLCKAMKPSYQLPSSKIISTSLLDTVHKETDDYNKINLKGKKVAILQDGWSTKQNVPIIAHCLHTGNKTVFLNAVSTSVESKTASYCLGLLEDAIKIAETIYECVVVGAGTDNCETMNSMRRQFAQKYPEINVFGCESHIFNLLGQDLTPPDLIKNVVSVQKFFRSHHFESAALKNLGGSRPVLPGRTRWSSQLDTLRSFNMNQTKYLEVSRMQKSNFKKSSDLLLFLNQSNVYEQVESALKLMEPVAISLDIVRYIILLYAITIK